PRDAVAARERLDGLAALVADTEGLAPGREDELRSERERLRHVTELASGSAAAVAALAGEDERGAADFVAEAERAVAPLERLAPELAAAGESLRAAELALRETASDLRAFLDALEAEPGRLEQVEGELERLADLRRRYRAESYAELLERAVTARSELEAIAGGHDPAAAAGDALAAAQAEVDRLHAALRAVRAKAPPAFAEAVAQ